jgi:hypothetical protein
MKENQEKMERLVGESKFVDRNVVEIQEKSDSAPKEFLNPSTPEIIRQLTSGVCTLFFYKVTNGSFRRMRCTLQNVSAVPSKYNRQGVVPVWDLDANQWRSFYPNRVYKLIRNEKTDIQ